MSKKGSHDSKISKLYDDQDDRHQMLDGSNILKDDCLRLIFEYLPIVDRIRVERVCKRWQQSFRSFWRSVRSLNFKKEVWGIHMPLNVFAIKITLNIIKDVLLRCGQNLKILDFEYYDGDFDSGEVHLVAKLCPQLEQLNFPYPILSESLVSLNKHCQNITNISMGLDATYFEEIGVFDLLLKMFFHKNPRLRQIHFVSEAGLDWECLYHLHRDIEFISLTQNLLTFSECLDVVKEFPQLEGLMINSSYDVADEIIESISSCLTLKFLKLNISCFLGNRRPINILNLFSNLINLQELDLSINDLVDDSFLIHISTKLEHLRYLNIARCSAVTNAGVTSLASFKNLKYLNVGMLRNITDDAFGAPFNLSCLLCYECNNIRDDGLIQLLQCSEQLEHLDVSLCPKMTNKLVEAAVRITNERLNNLILKLYIEGTGTEMCGTNNTSANLKLIEEQFSEEKLPLSELARRTPRRAGRFYRSAYYRRRGLV